MIETSKENLRLRTRYFAPKNIGLCLALILALLLPFFGSNYLAQATDFPENQAQEQDLTPEQGEGLEQEYVYRPYKYDNYMKEHTAYSRPNFDQTYMATEASVSEGALLKPAGDLDYPDALEWSNQTGLMTWTVDLPQEGLYKLALEYFPTPGRSGNIEFEITINGKFLVEEARQIAFGRTWRDEREIIQDNRGNDLRPTQVDYSMWMREDFKDEDGLYNYPYLFLLEEGENIISLRCIRESLLVNSLRIYNEEDLPSYSEYRDRLEKLQSSEANLLELDKFEKYFQAEKASLKSHPSLYPIADRISPLTSPYHPSKIRLNSIGGYNWRFPGQWIEWEVDVPVTGDYVIALRSRQDQLRGLYSHRRLSIDGEVPFAEMDEILYEYNINWQVNSFAGDEAYLFRLEKGKHVLRMEAIIGSMGDTIRAVESAVYDLNSLYRKIIMITGVTPDLYRDYELEKEIPELTSEFLRIAKLLEDELSRIEGNIGKKSPESALLLEIALQLRSLASNPLTISERLERYKNNISSLSAWMVERKDQPLEVDYIWIASASRELPRAKETFFEKLVHNVKTFFYSFVENYDLIGNTVEGQEAISVWVGTGRDQAQITKAMIEDLFAPKAGVGVNVSLVQGTLLEATMAGKGPDVALNVARYLPVDLAVRGALMPLDGNEDFDKLLNSFQETAFVPYTFKGRVYAMPETLDFNMLFYRKDIFAELNLNPPDTWEELYDLISVLSRKNMDIGVPSIVPQTAGDSYMPFPRTFTTFLIQNGLGLYKENFESTAFDDIKAISAYKEFINLYKEFGLPVYYDYANRFRTGEMPLGIASYSTYNYLYIFAPEIRNMWEMRPIPGVKREDGSIDRSEEGYGSACIVFDKTRNKEGARQFVYWWTSNEAQTRFAREMESLMGPAARQTVANLDAFENLPWSASELSHLKIQREQIVEQPEIPGSYFVSRNLNNAIIETIFENGNSLATLEKYNKYINEEIKRKRIEFDLD